jgi:hypothetical protein
MAASGSYGVWLAGQGSCKVMLYHATTYEQLLEVSVAPAVGQKLQSRCQWGNSILTIRFYSINRSGRDIALSMAYCAKKHSLGLFDPVNNQQNEAELK